MPKKEERGAEATPHRHAIKKTTITQEDKVLSHLKKYGSITSMQAFEEYGITRLASVVFKLRKQGYNIVTTTETSRRGKNYGRYFLRRTA